MTVSNKHTVKVNGHNTSVFIENDFWKELKRICSEKKISSGQLISEIDSNGEKKD